MGIAPYHRSYQRVRPAGRAYAPGYLPNPACRLTDQGADPDPADLAWCMRRRWRVIYYAARQAAGQPLWQGVELFEAAMVEVLRRLTCGDEPIAPLHAPPAARHESSISDGRAGRVYQPSCRVYRMPALPQREGIE